MFSTASILNDLGRHSITSLVFRLSKDLNRHCLDPFSCSVVLGADARPDLDLRDPVCDDFFQLWHDIAESNANIYEQVGIEGSEPEGTSWIILFRVGWRKATLHHHPQKGHGSLGSYHRIQWLRVGVRGDGVRMGAFSSAGLGLLARSPQTLLASMLPPPQIFRCLPSNAIRSLRALREYVTVEPLAMVSPPLARSELTQVQGHLVHFPLKFLEDESLLPPLGSKEGMIPLEVWT